MSYAPTFNCRYVPCKHCDGKTRLPLSNPLDIETHRINSPTETEPLTVLCPHCWKVSTYLREDFEEMVYPAAELSEGIPIYMIEILCGVLGCQSRIRVFVRVRGYLPEKTGIARALAALDGVNAHCTEGHPLKPNAETYFRKIQEHRESPL